MCYISGNGVLHRFLLYIIAYLDGVILWKKKSKGCGFSKNYLFGLNILVTNGKKNTKKKIF